MTKKPSLAETHPELASQAIGWDPTTLTAGSNKKRFWICKTGHQWESVVLHRTHGNGCPVCSGHKVLPGFNDLQTTHPEVAAQADGWDPKTVSRGSHRKLGWVCEFDHRWETAVFHRTRGHGCPICGGKKVLVGTNDLAATHPEIAVEAFGWDPSTLVSGSNKRRKWRCTEGHIWETTPNSRTTGGRKKTGNGCAVCSGRKVLAGYNDLATTHPEIAATADGWDPKLWSRGSHEMRLWKCKVGHSWSSVIKDRVFGDACSYCSGRKALKGFNDLESLFPEIAAEADGWDPSTVVAYSNKRQEWKCKLGHTFSVAVNNRVRQGSACPYCNGGWVWPGFNDLMTTHPQVAAEAQGWDPKKVIAGSNVRLLWRCKEAHEYKASPHNRAGNGRGCPSCAKSGFDPNEKGWLYLIENDFLGLLQIGITNDPTTRLAQHHRRGWIDIDIRGPMDGGLTRELETAILRKLKKVGAQFANRNDFAKFDGWGESWIKASSQVDNIADLLNSLDV